MTLVYQAYGRADILRQTLFSIVSLLKSLPANSNLKLVVYTDDRGLFERFFGSSVLEIVDVNAEQIQRWRGAINFVHRVKVEILRDAGQKFKGPLFYVDGDTYFRESPLPLFAKVSDQSSLMHIAENKIDEGRDPLSKKIARFLKKNQFLVGGENVKVSPSTVMWNAGAIGISENNKKYLPLVLELTDKMHAVYPKHIQEQLAFSYYLQTRTQVFSGDAVIGHYWNQKEEYQTQIDEFLRAHSTLEKALQAYENFAWPAAPTIKAKRSIWPDWLRF